MDKRQMRLLAKGLKRDYATVCACLGEHEGRVAKNSKVICLRGIRDGLRIRINELRTRLETK